jgi:excinuclease ABC subunit C
VINPSILEAIPSLPGVYFFKNKSNDIIYIGKAKILKNRVRSYFTASGHGGSKTDVLVKNIKSIEWLVVRDDIEAILTEANLIKEYRPKYNILLKDDKSFPYIQITKESYPQVILVRLKKLPKYSSLFFGPYTDTRQLRESLKVIHKIFPLRTCNFNINNKSIIEKKYQICLDYHIKRCDGPCEGFVSQKKYNEMIKLIIQFLRGRDKKIKTYLKSEMNNASNDLRFEDAVRFRDQYHSISNFMKKQKKVTQDGIDRDILVATAENKIGIGVILKVRNGFFIGKEKFNLTISFQSTDEDIITDFFRQYYSSTMDIPKEILIEHPITDKENHITWLSKISNHKVLIMIPKIGEKKRLVEICRKNCELQLKEILNKKLKRKELIPNAVEQLKEDLNMSIPPRRIEGFDNSNIQGEFPVAGMVCFIDGKPIKKEYRKFNIKSVNGPDDFKSMYEVISRRYSRVIKEKTQLPDLILIDGGKGQLSVAKSALDHLGLSYITVIGLAKKLEEVFLPHFSDPQNIAKHSSGLLFLRRIRDEVHRYAISFHRQKRSKAQNKSILLTIPNMGPKRVLSFWNSFNSFDEVKKLTTEDIYNRTKIPIDICKKILVLINKKSYRNEPNKLDR